MDDAVISHYARGEILESILDALKSQGKDLSALTAADLAPVDEFHIRGRAATIELANLAALRPGLRVLDVGSGLGGSVRYLAAERDCRAVGIDLTEEYVHTAQALAALVGLERAVEFRQASALALPFADQSFALGRCEPAFARLEQAGGGVPSSVTSALPVRPPQF